jgi:FAD/FMN-containing dehydrogenase
MGDDRATVDAGVRWSELVGRALAAGKTPPVLTDFLELTVGGTLSVGGVSGTSFRYGVQVDNVLELQVVTGEGEKLTCSDTQNKELFEAVLAGLGQCAIIVQATIRLVPAPAMVRLYDLGYADGGTQARDVVRANESGRFDYVLGFVVPGPDGGWVHRIHALGFHKDGAPPEDARLLEGLSYQKGSEQIMDLPYLMWVNRLVPQLAELKNLGHYSRPHPWCDLLVPASKIETLLGEVLKEVPPTEITPQFPVLMYGFKRERLSRPLFRTPNEDTFFLLDVLRTAAPETQGAAQMVAHNRKLYERNRQWGGTYYTISAIAMSPEDWKQHYGPAWDGLVAAKRRYDPDSVLTPGPGIFA